MRAVNTRVFPDPAPASTSMGPSKCKTASRWAGFNPASGSAFSVTSVVIVSAIISRYLAKHHIEGGAALRWNEGQLAAVTVTHNPARQRKADSPPLLLG